MAGLVTKSRFTSFECVHCKAIPESYISSAFPLPSSTCSHDKLKCLLCGGIFETFGEAFIHTIKENMNHASAPKPIDKKHTLG